MKMDLWNQRLIVKTREPAAEGAKEEGMETKGWTENM